jgi:DNA-binding protein HU-beta
MIVARDEITGQYAARSPAASNSSPLMPAFWAEFDEERPKTSRFKVVRLIFRASGELRTAINIEIQQLRCHKPRPDMTKTELQVALAAATETNKRTAGVFLDTLNNLAYKEIKKNGEFVLPGFGKLVKQKRKARSGFNPKTQQKIKIPAKTVVKFRVAKAAKDAVLGVKK